MRKDVAVKMFYLLLAVIAGTAKGFCGKKLSGYVNSISESAAANIIRMIICCVIGAAMAFVKRKSFALTPAELAISVFSGISMAVFLISWLISAKSGAYMMINAVTTAATEVLPSVILFPLSSVLSLAVATVMAAVFFGEKITKTSAAGIVCTVISVLLS